MRLTPLWRAVVKLAGTQHGVISTDQLLGLGLTRSAIKYRVGAGQLHPMHRGVYAVGRPDLTQKGHFMAAILACGESCALSHRSAAARLDLRACSRTVVEVTVSGRTARSRPGIQVHTGTLLTRDVTIVDGIPCTTPARTFLDLAEVVHPDSLAKALERAEILRVFDLHQFHDLLARGERPPRRRHAHRSHDRFTAPAPTRNELERRFLALCDTSSLPSPLVNSPLELEGETFKIDFLWPEHRLVVETDGWETHGTRTQFERDRLRDQHLVLAGYRVLRFTWRQVVDTPSEVAATVAAALEPAYPVPSSSASV